MKTILGRHRRNTLHSISPQLFALAVCTSLAIGTVSCHNSNRNFDKESISKIKNADPFGKAIQTPDLFTAGRQWAQTRSVINLQIAEAYGEQIQEVSLYNSSLSQTLINRKVLSLGLNLDEDQSFDLTAGGSHLLIRIYPSLSGTLGKFVYGKNSILMLTNSGVSSRKSSVDVTLRDFTYFGAVFSGPVSGVTPEKPLSGGINGIANGVSSNGSGFLMTNPTNVLVH